jgi:hypothetical protein
MWMLRLAALPGERSADPPHEPAVAVARCRARESILAWCCPFTKERLLPHEDTNNAEEMPVHGWAIHVPAIEDA